MTKQFIYLEKDGEVYAEENPKWKQEMAKKKYDLFLKKSEIPTFYYGIEFSDYKGNKESKSYKSVLYYAENLDNPEFDHAHLYLYGINSSQKTALAINILKEGIRKGLKVKFVLAGDLTNKLLKNQGFKQDEDIIYYLKDLDKCDVICIDDAFDPDKTLMWKTSANKNMIVSEWDILLRHFLSSGTKIIFTSNFTPDIIEQYYSKSLFELVDRNCALLEFKESIKVERKSIVKNLFDSIEGDE